MKNRVLTFLMIAGMVALLVGCGNATKATLAEGTYIANSSEEEILKDEDEKDVLTFKVNKPSFVETDELAFAIDYIDDIYEEYEAYVKEEILPVAKENLEFMPENEVDFIVERDFKVKKNDGKIISIVIIDTQYTGGAHGGTSEMTVNFDLENKKVLTLNEVFKVNREDYIPILHDKVVEKIESLKADEEATFFEEYGVAVDDAFADDHFYLEDDKIVFVYGEYSIAPYSEGPQEIGIELAELKEIVRPEYLK